MKNRLLIAVILLSVSCSGDVGVIRFGDLAIPMEYVLHAPSYSTKGIFDDEGGTIALVVSEEEVKDSIPLYQIESRGASELTFVLYQAEIDMGMLNESAFFEIDKSNVEVEELDKYLPYRRLYRDSSDWLLVSGNGDGMKFEADCGLTGAHGEVEVCRFKKNINGYGVYFILKNKNISLMGLYEKFIFKRIGEWRIITIEGAE